MRDTKSSPQPESMGDRPSAETIVNSMVQQAEQLPSVKLVTETADLPNK